MSDRSADSRRHAARHGHDRRTDRPRNENADPDRRRRGRPRPEDEVRFDWRSWPDDDDTGLR